MKKTIVTVAASTFLVVSLIIWFFGEPSTVEAPIPTPTVAPSPSVAQVMSPWKKSFMDACNVETGFERYCSCTYDFMANKYSSKELVRIDNMSPEQMSVYLQPAVEACADYLL